MPMVTHLWGMSSRAPPRSPTQLVARVSGWMSSTRVGSWANCSGVSSGWGSLKARWPVMPMPPKAMSTPPSSSMRAGMRPRSLGSGNTRCSSGMSSSGSILPYTFRAMKPRKDRGSFWSIHWPSSVRYSSMLMNQQFFRDSFSRFTRRTKMGYWPTGPTGQMKTVCLPAALLARMALTISRAIS